MNGINAIPIKEFLYIIRFLIHSLKLKIIYFLMIIKSKIIILFF